MRKHLLADVHACHRQAEFGQKQSHFARSASQIDNGFCAAIFRHRKQILRPTCVVAVIFGFLTLVALTVAVAKLVKGLLSHRNQGTEIPWAGIGMAFGATIVCGVVAGAGFFGWFGLS